jgi:hypothetical protein
MTLVDLMHHFVEDVMPIVAPLCIVVAAGFLWHRTRRVSALVQLVAAVLLLYGMTVDRYGWHSNGLDAVWSEPIRISRDIAMFLGFVLFPVSYLLYALRQTRI